jgi:hypothetical protein
MTDALVSAIRESGANELKLVTEEGEVDLLQEAKADGEILIPQYTTGNNPYGLSYNGPLINPMTLGEDEIAKIHYELVNDPMVHKVIATMSKIVDQHPESMALRPALPSEVMLIEPLYKELLPHSDKFPCPCVMLVGKFLIVAIPPYGVAGTEWRNQLPSYKSWYRQLFGKQKEKKRVCRFCKVPIICENLGSKHCCNFHKELDSRKD